MIGFAIASMIALILSIVFMGKKHHTASNAHNGTVYGDMPIIIMDIEMLYIGTCTRTNESIRPKYRKWSIFALLHPHPL